MAIKKIIKHYPEFTPKKRRSKIQEKEVIPPPIYQILPSGEKIQIELPVQKERTLTTMERFEIKKWPRESVKVYTFSYDAYTDMDDPEEEEELENVEESVKRTKG